MFKENYTEEEVSKMSQDEIAKCLDRCFIEFTFYEKVLAEKQYNENKKRYIDAKKDLNKYNKLGELFNKYYKE